MRHFLIAAAATLAMTPAAIAADMAARPYTKAPPAYVATMYDWSGMYIGANGGWGSSDNCWDFAGNTAAPIAANIGHGCHRSDGGTAGGQIGYNWQMSSWVFGVEAQGNWADFSGSNVSAVFPLSSTRTTTDAFGLFTGRIGYAFDNTLLYVRGGAALTSNEHDFYPTLTGIRYGVANETRWGAAVGAGLEYGFAPNWSVAVQYDHMFLGEQQVGFNTVFGTSSDRISQDIDLVTARLNYRWGGPAVGRY
jgi:outer membrane immunogenic protein